MSSIFLRNFDIAAASISCFSHFEYDFEERTIGDSIGEARGDSNVLERRLLLPVFKLLKGSMSRPIFVIIEFTVRAFLAGLSTVCASTF